MPSKEKSDDGLDSQSSGNNLNGSSSQISNKSSKSNGSRNDSPSGSDSDRESTASHSQRSSQRSSQQSSKRSSQQSSQRSQTSFSQHSNKSTSSVCSNNQSQSQVSSKSGSDSDSTLNGSRQTEHSQNSRVTNSQQSNNSSIVLKSKGRKENSERSGSDSESNSQRTDSQQSKISHSQLSNKSGSSVISKSQTQSQNSNKSGSDNNTDSDGSVVIKSKKSMSKKAGYFSDSDDEKSTTITTVKAIQPLDDSDSDDEKSTTVTTVKAIQPLDDSDSDDEKSTTVTTVKAIQPLDDSDSDDEKSTTVTTVKAIQPLDDSDSDDEKSTTVTTVKAIQPLDDSDSDAIIHTSSKKKPMSKNSIRKLLEEDSSSDDESKNSKLKANELASDSSGKSSSGSSSQNNKNLKARRRVIQRVESDSSDEESAVSKTLPKNSRKSVSVAGLPATKPDWKKSLGASQTNDSSSGDEHGLSPKSVGPSDPETEPSPMRQNKKFRKTKQKSDSNEATVPSWKKSMGAGLLDDSSSEDERGLDVPSPVPSSESEARPSPKSQNKKFRKTKETSKSLPKKPAKEMQLEAKDAHSHSQRHHRVDHAELPYHVPKQRSLAEFMARRQTLPAASSTSLKMPSWQLKAHWKQMAEQEKEASLFFKSESDHSEDETEKNLNQVSAILSKELADKLVEPVESTVEEKSQEKSIDAVDESTAIAVVNEVTTSVENGELGTTSVASDSNKEIPEDILMDCVTDNLPETDEKMIVDSEIDDNTTPITVAVPVLSMDCDNIDENNDNLLKKNENPSDVKDSVDDDNSSDSDCALRLSDSEDEKEKERPSSKTENSSIQTIGMNETEEQKAYTTEKQPKVFEFCDISSDSDIEAASNAKPSVLDKNNDSSDKKLAMLRRRGLIDVANIKPRLSGNKNEIIDLDEDVESKRTGVMDLMQRFIKHSTKKKPKGEKKEVELSIVSAEQGSDGLENVKKELVTIMLGDDEEVRDPVPGAKLQRLKQTLQKQMALKRNADWKRKMEEKRINSEVLGDEELSDCGMLDEETEMTDSEEEDEEGGDNEEVDDEEADDEEEEEEIEMPLKEKKRPQREFVDEEADESDEGDADVSDDEDEEDADEDAKDSDKEEKDKDDPADKLISEDDNIKHSQSKSKFKRLQTFDMFDSDDDLETSILEKWAALEAREATTPTSPMITPGQNAKSPIDSQFTVSPMIFNRRSAPTQESPIDSLLNKAASSTADDEHCVASTQDYLNEIMKGTTAKPKEPKHTSSLSKFLFKAGVTNTQTEEDELMSLCSGKFQTQADKSADEELAALCSGRFPSQTQVQEDELDTDRDDLSQDAQDFGEETQTKGEKSLTVASSPKIPLSVRKETVQPWVDLDIVSDDEEDEHYNHDSKLKKKTQKKLNFSDEEDDEDEVANGVDDLEEDVGAEEEDDAADESAGEVDYDSEENEVRADGEKARQAAKDFFEAEAELSESEWGSADEDEKDLDKLDYAAADEEQFDQDQMKEQLDKIHMRQILDADKREVRMLQEMLFEDGDLHTEGGGRERKFRWKNLGDDDMNSGLRGDSGDEGAGDEDEAEDEEKWRIMRHERETFLREQKEKAEAAGKEDQGILEDEDSQFLKLGKAALKRIRSVHSQEQIAIERKITLRKSVSDILMSPDAKRKCNPVVQRGSFLARGESALARIAAITRGTTGKVVLNAKNSRNFVFTAISPKEEVVEEPVKVPGKRKAPIVTPTLLKKAKVSVDKSKGRRLFDHLN